MLAKPASVRLPRERGGARKHEREGRHPGGALPAAREALAEEDGAGDDRQCVRPENGEAGGRESGPALERELQADEGEAVRGEHRRNEEEPAAAGDRRLGGDVARRVENARGGAEPGAGGEF